jgi:hypothetical protein
MITLQDLIKEQTKEERERERRALEIIEQNRMAEEKGRQMWYLLRSLASVVNDAFDCKIINIQLNDTGKESIVYIREENRFRKLYQICCSSTLITLYKYSRETGEPCGSEYFGTAITLEDYLKKEIVKVIPKIEV